MSDKLANGLDLLSASETETITIGERIGALLSAGDLVLLLAPFGAGKTYLTKGIAAGLGADADEVNSPSFVVINEYTADAAHHQMPIYHADLYRIETPHGLGTVGLEACLQGDGVCIVEWAERARDWLPQDRLEIAIEVLGPATRRLRVVPHGAYYAALVDDLAATMVANRGNDPQPAPI
jgi:tRNA threonylcarbamoyladenosine biosynthesis protein TsaE